ncbi:MAG: hypothetical protein AB8H86_08605 [Polyangiales bacterium]
MNKSFLTGLYVVLLGLPACGFVGIDELPAPDAERSDAANDVPAAVDAGGDTNTMDVFRPDVPSDGALPDAGSDVGSDALVRIDAGSDAGPDAGSDAGPDAGSDAGSCSPPRWGVSDDDTSDVAGDDFGRQIWTVRLCSVPELGEQMTLLFRARITAPGTMHDYDLMATYMWINGTGGSSGGIDRTWAPVRVEDKTFSDYTLLLPADIDDDGVVDWVVGDNELELRVWSEYNDRLGKTGVDSLVLIWP